MVPHERSVVGREFIGFAKDVMKMEADSIIKVASLLDERFLDALKLLLGCRGKVVVSGIGKSGIIARKMAATLSSTGTPSFFLHPAEASHGDLGMITESDVLILISYGGNSPELTDLVKFMSRKNVRNIVITGNPNGMLAKHGEVFLDCHVDNEACPLGLAPTSSTTTALALTDALAMTLLKAKGFERRDFAEFHPGGSLGKKLLTHVKDVMHQYESVAWVEKEASMKTLLTKMTTSNVRGVAGVLSSTGELIGAVTDGDVRRFLESHDNLLGRKVSDLMSFQPKTVSMNELAETAALIMEKHSVDRLFVLDPKTGLPKGLIHFGDLLKEKIV